MHKYKFSLNLPKTKFPMRANLPSLELKILQDWFDVDLYKIVRNSKKDKKIFLLHDGPPYANGKIHIGHSVNKILKDIIIKFKGMSGFNAPYIPGWDCHGLPIELKVEEMISKSVKRVTKRFFRKLCREYAFEQIQAQKKDFIRLGVLGDWENPYLTMNFKIEANIIRAFSKIIDNGYLYKGSKPVHWCLNCCSALAEAEVEYHEKKSLSIYVLFNAMNRNEVCRKFSVLKVEGDISLVVWTTTPWSIPANRGICLHPSSDYFLVQIKGCALIILKNLFKKVFERIGITEWKILGVCKGSSLEFQKFYHPFLKGIESLVVLGEYVDLNTGTGSVHIAPGYGLDDYFIAKKYGMEISNVISQCGIYLKGTHPLLDGVHIFKVNKIILAILEEKKALLCQEDFHHSYPHCWRHKSPLIFRATSQWFIGMDKKELRAKVLNAVKKVDWNSEKNALRITKMLESRPDWCVSRQRIWGVPMALFVHKMTGNLHPNTLELMEKVAQCVEKKGVQAWWDLDPYDFIGQDANSYFKIPDILDVWFDSGSTHYTLITMRPEFFKNQIDMYLEGSDQHRGWFMSSLIISTAIKGSAPYRKVLTHGFVVDAEGRKMSKSVGNTIASQDIINRFGADVFRLWVASANYSSEMSVSEEILRRSSDNYRRIRNTARFFLANLADFNPSLHQVQEEKMIVFDRWAVGCAKTAQGDIIKSYVNYNFHEVIQRILHFCSVEMGSCYLDVIKDRQYTTKYNSLARRSSQTAIWHITEAFVRWIAPIISFTADEIWRYMPGTRSKYVFTEEWYENLFGLPDDLMMNNAYWSEILRIRGEINKEIEILRRKKHIGSSLEVFVNLYAIHELAIKLKVLGNELRFVFLTSGVRILDYVEAGVDAKESKNLQGLKVALYKARGEKCPRCWHYTEKLRMNSEGVYICDRCYLNTEGEGEERKFS